MTLQLLFSHLLSRTSGAMIQVIFGPDTFVTLHPMGRGLRPAGDSGMGVALVGNECHLLINGKCRKSAKIELTAPKF